MAICFELVVNFGTNIEAARQAHWQSPADSSINKLVLCNAMRDELGLGGNYVEFRPGYLRIPYRRKAEHTYSWLGEDKSIA
jgi:hypothetical protein